jgi:UDP-GlcNAc:undecaprenyl-phosphate GlcNAc-1-phosphate transferase
MMTILAVILFAGAMVLSAVLTRATIRIATKADFVARPQADRYHRTIIPLGGGCAIFATMAFFSLAAIIAVQLLAVPGLLDWLGEDIAVHVPGFQTKTNQLMVVIGCAALLFALGLYDDRKHLSAGPKLLGQFIAAFIAIHFADIRVEFFIESSILTSILSAFWIVLLVNVFNFLDNMDGASAGIAAIASLYIFIAAALSGQVFVGAMALLLAGTLSGFLLFNFPPAKIFMGDAGSLVVGFFVAVLTLRTNYYLQDQGGDWHTVFLPLIVLAVPMYDFISVTILRISQGKSPFVGDTQHFSHRLKRRGLSDRQTVLALYLATVCTGLGATFLYQVDLAGAVLIFIQTFLILAIIAILESTAKNDRTSD